MLELTAFGSVVMTILAFGQSFGRPGFLQLVLGYALVEITVAVRTPQPFGFMLAAKTNPGQNNMVNFMRPVRLAVHPYWALCSAA